MRDIGDGRQACLAMTEPEWIAPDTALAIEEEQVGEHGGADGVRDQGLSESALARPRSAWGYGVQDTCLLATLRNERTACVAVETYLVQNGFALLASDAESRRHARPRRRRDVRGGVRRLAARSHRAAPLNQAAADPICFPCP